MHAEAVRHLLPLKQSLLFLLLGCERPGSSPLLSPSILYIFLRAAQTLLFDLLPWKWVSGLKYYLDFLFSCEATQRRKDIPDTCESTVHTHKHQLPSLGAGSKIHPVARVRKGKFWL